ncbi:RNA exonuclease 3 [Ceratocystis pirilliformis]|uniref:RNA exonuclease 3 n=1 Tax=Ceratocystis pirilliformis TaxID=259994 RepID=A0ABR3Z6Y1_9PEZI
MAATLPNLKHLPCPAGPACTAFKCLFGHADRSDDSQNIPPESNGEVNTIPQPPASKKRSFESPVTADGPLAKRVKSSTNLQSLSDSSKQTSQQPLKPEPAVPVANIATHTASVPKSETLLQQSQSQSLARLGSNVAYLPAQPKPSTASVQRAPSLLGKPGPTSSNLSSAASNIPTTRQKPPRSRLESCASSAPSLGVPPKTIKQPAISTAPASKLLPKLPPVPLKAPPRPQKGALLTPKTVAADPIGFAGRLKVIQMFHAELIRLDGLLRDTHSTRIELFLSQDEANKMAVDIEGTVAAGPSNVYRNIVGARLSGYKKMITEAWLKERELAKAPPKPKGDDGNQPKIIDTGLTPEQEVFVAGLIETPIRDLAQYGYVSTPPSEADVAKASAAMAMSKGWEKCDRCEQRFQVFPDRRLEDGSHTSGGSCTHHYGRLYWMSPVSTAGKTRAKGDRKFRCCNQAVGDSTGCATKECHVFKVTDTPRLAHVLPFVETPPNEAPATDAKAVCFDCEMCYTVNGIELVRLTATAWPSGAIILDVLVQPQGAILDLNSRYSGVFPQDMANAQPWDGFEEPIAAPIPGNVTAVRSSQLKIVSSPAAARELLFALITPDTLLIGHGLENDLNTTRIIHPKIIDTVLLYPTRGGLPFRMGLKVLASTHLNRKIQVDDGTGQGHDSAEDARASGELVRVKVREKWISMQAKGWRLKDGEFVAPP